jgi:hypothetical protein
VTYGLNLLKKNSRYVRLLLILRCVSKYVKSGRSLHYALLFVSPSACMEQLGSHWMDFHEILNTECLLKSVEKIQVWLQSDNNIRHFI